MRKLSLFLLILGAVLSFSYKSIACSCSSAGSVCEAYGGASIVFIGLVTKNVDGVSQIKVEETFAGELETAVKAFSSATFCGFGFQDGRRYLIYAHAKPEEGEKVKSFFASRCTRTQLLENAAEDLDFLRNQRQKMKGGRIYGRVLKDSSDNYDLPAGQWVLPLPEVRVQITGTSQTYDLFTDKTGLFEIDNLLSGEYSIEVGLPKESLLYGNIIGNTRTKFINTNGCAGTNFLVKNE